MYNIIHKILKRTKDLAQWKYLIKSNFYLANVMGKSVDLKLEELRLERNELDARTKLLSQKQRSIETMLTDLTRSIRQMEFDIDMIQKEAKAASQCDQDAAQPAQQEKSQQKI